MITCITLNKMNFGSNKLPLFFNSGNDSPQFRRLPRRDTRQESVVTEKVTPIKAETQMFLESQTKMKKSMEMIEIESKNDTAIINQLGVEKTKLYNEIKDLDSQYNFERHEQSIISDNISKLNNASGNIIKLYNNNLQIMESCSLEQKSFEKNKDQYYLQLKNEKNKLEEIYASHCEKGNAISTNNNQKNNEHKKELNDFDKEYATLQQQLEEVQQNIENLSAANNKKQEKYVALKVHELKAKEINEILNSEHQNKLSKNEIFFKQIKEYECSSDMTLNELDKRINLLTTEAQTETSTIENIEKIMAERNDLIANLKKQIISFEDQKQHLIAEYDCLNKLHTETNANFLKHYEILKTEITLKLEKLKNFNHNTSNEFCNNNEKKQKIIHLEEEIKLKLQLLEQTDTEVIGINNMCAKTLHDLDIYQEKTQNLTNKMEKNKDEMTQLETEIKTVEAGITQKTVSSNLLWEITNTEIESAMTDFNVKLKEKVQGINLYKEKLDELSDENNEFEGHKNNFKKQEQQLSRNKTEIAMLCGEAGNNYEKLVQECNSISNKNLDCIFSEFAVMEKPSIFHPQPKKRAWDELSDSSYEGITYTAQEFLQMKRLKEQRQKMNKK